MKKAQHPRLAGQDERARALELVTMYRLAQQSPDGRFCINPADDPIEQSFICKDDPEHLLYMLEQFAEHGTFGVTDTSVADRLVLRLQKKHLQAGGLSYYDAVAELADKRGVSSRSIERAMAKEKSAKV